MPEEIAYRGATPCPHVEFERLLRYVATMRKFEPARLEDAAEVLDVWLTDRALALICRAKGPGAPVVARWTVLCCSSELRQRLWDELADLDMANDGEGWLEDLLTPGCCEAMLARYAEKTRGLEPQDGYA